MESTSCLLMFNLHSLSYTGQAEHGLPFNSLPTVPMIASPHSCFAHPYNSLSCPLSRHSLRQRIGLRLSHRHDSLFSAKIDSWHVEGQTNEQQNKSLIIYPGRQRLKAAPVREKPHPLFFFGPFERASASFHSNMFDVASTAAIQRIKSKISERCITVEEFALHTRQSRDWILVFVQQKFIESQFSDFYKI